MSPELILREVALGDRHACLKAWSGPRPWETCPSAKNQDLGLLP